MADLAELLERVKAATGPSLDLDHAIHDLFADGDGAPLYTASLDAALALVERVRPGWTVKLHIENGRGLHGAVAELIEPPSKWGEYCREEFAKTPALAALAALLRSLVFGDEAGEALAAKDVGSAYLEKAK